MMATAVINITLNTLINKCEMRNKENLAKQFHNKPVKQEHQQAPFVVAQTQRFSGKPEAMINIRR